MPLFNPFIQKPYFEYKMYFACISSKIFFKEKLSLLFYNSAIACRFPWRESEKKSKDWQSTRKLHFITVILFNTIIFLCFLFIRSFRLLLFHIFFFSIFLFILFFCSPLSLYAISCANACWSPFIIVHYCCYVCVYVAVCLYAYLFCFVCAEYWSSVTKYTIGIRMQPLNCWSELKVIVSQLWNTKWNTKWKRMRENDEE